MAPRSLFKMALNVTCRHINDIDDISNMPASIAMQIVKHVNTAQQLHTLELSNPEIADQTGHLWKAFIKRDIPNLKPEHMYEPRNPRSWHKVYKKIRREEDEREAAQEEALRQTLLGDRVKKAENQAVFVDKILSHARSGNESSVFVDGVRKQRQSNSQPSVQRSKTGTQAIAAIRRQAALNSRQMSHAQPFKATPTPSRQIKQAPQSMVRELNLGKNLEFQPRELAPHQKEILREHKKMQAYNRIVAPSRFPSAKKAEADRRNAAAVQQARQVNEAKLRALTERENAAAAAKKPAAKKFELEPAPVTITAKSTSQSSQPQSVTFSASPPPASSAASASSAKKINVSVSPPGTPSQKPTTIIKKRPAPTNIFMTNKKVKR